MSSRTLEDLVDECKQFIQLKNKNRHERNPPVGQPSFLVSKAWWRRYKDYVFYKEVKSHSKPEEPTADRHPGPISNLEDICDASEKNLRGTGKVEAFEAECVDLYLKPNVSERYDFKVINQELHMFLHSRYGGTVVKRYSIPQGTYYTMVEIRLKQVPLVFLPVSKLYAGGEQLLGLDEEFNIQISKRKNYLDLKRRILDAVNHKFQLAICEGDLRLWKFGDEKGRLVDACQQVSQREERIEVDSSNDDDLEYNSGVEFPGDSLEPYYSTSSVLEDDTLNDSHVIVEFRESEHLKFAFQYRKNQRIFIGKCEFCTQKKILKIECACKRVRYCNEQCLGKDTRWHIPNCSAQADAELQKGVSSFKRSPNARNGKVGLGNLGNTCYMNSSL